MTRLAIGLLIGLGIGIVVAAAVGIHAAGTDPDDETVAAAQEASVDAIDLLGAVNTTGLGPRDYLVAVGELAAPPPLAAPALSPPGWPFGGPVAQRIYCVEGIESSHGRAMYNPTPWYGEHAQGWLGWLPSTARRWGVTIGNRASEWDGARRMIVAGAGRQFYGIAAGRC